MSTPELTAYAFRCGTATIPKSLIIDNSEGEITLPIMGFLIKHPDGLVVFDSGFNRRVHTDPTGDYVPAGFYDTRHFAFGPDDEMQAQMRRFGFNPDDVRYVASSHGHYDHAGGNDQFPKATVIIQEAEFRAVAVSPEEAPAYRPADLLTTQTKLLVNGEYDIFNDGSMVLIPTVGHTPGHQSLRVLIPGQPLFFTADACYLEQTLDENVVPGVKTNEADFLASLAAIRARREAGDFVLFGHDPDFWEQMPLAPEPLTVPILR